MNNQTDPIFSKYDQLFGKTTPTTSAPRVSTWADEINQQSQQNQDSNKESLFNQPTYFNRVGGEYKQAGEDIKSGIQQGADTYQQGIKEGGFGGIMTSTKGLLESGVNTVGNIAKAAFTPITEALKPVIQPFVDKLAQDPSTQHLINPIIEFANKHPEVAHDLGNIVDIATLGVGGAAEKPIAGAVKDVAETGAKGISSAIDATKEAFAKGTEDTGVKSTEKAIDAIKSTEDTMTKSERQQAIDEGRVKVSKLGKTEYLPSDTEKRAGEILAGKLKSNPVKNVPIIKSEIATRGAEAEKYLEKNPIKITAQEQADMFSEHRATAEKYLDEPQLKAYDDQMKLFLKQLPGRGGYNTANFYKALKDYEANVASNLARGKEALLDATGTASAKLRAAKDIRQIVRDEIGKRHPEFKPKMFDLASLYDSLDNTIIKAEKTTGTSVGRFAKKHPYITGSITGAVGGRAVEKLITGN